MSVGVVCISRTVGAEGETIGQTVAQRLGFRYVDEEIITRAAQQAQVDPAVVAAAEHKRPLLQRVLDKLAMAADLAGPAALGTGIPVDAFLPTPGQHVERDDLRILIRGAIHEVAHAGNAVIVAHAASMALAGAAGVFRVLVTASPALRAQRLATAQSISLADAVTAVAASDRERREYFQRFYKITDELPTHYDLVINTDVLRPAQAVEAIVAAAQSQP